MSENGAYLFGRAGPFGLLFPAAMVSRVWDAADNAPVPDGTITIDLRRLFAVTASGTGARVGLRAADTGRILVVDQVATLRRLAQAHFAPLPAAFRYAQAMFDAVCRQPVDGVYALRLRGDPAFVAMAEWAV
jgi:hypothetical protein